MRICRCLSELYAIDFELTDLFAMRQRWHSGALFSMSRPRSTNGLIYLSSCTGEYRGADGTSFFANKKSLVLLPRGSRYTVLNVDCAKSGVDAILIEFNVRVNGEEISLGETPMLIDERGDYEIVRRMEEIVNAYEACRDCPSAVKAGAYGLLAHLAARQQGRAPDKYESVRQGIGMIEGNAYGSDSVESIARECNVSQTHFRRLFKEYAHKSPVQYRTELKVTYAKRMLEETDMTVAAIAEALGYESDSYFCRVFKKQTNRTPTEYRCDLVR